MFLLANCVKSRKPRGVAVSVNYDWIVCTTSDMCFPNEINKNWRTFISLEAKRISFALGRLFVLKYIPAYMKSYLWETPAYKKRHILRNNICEHCRIRNIFAEFYTTYYLPWKGRSSALSSARWIYKCLFKERSLNFCWEIMRCRDWPSNKCFGFPPDWIKDMSFHIENHSGKKCTSVFLMAKKRGLSIFTRKTITCC